MRPLNDLIDKVQDLLGHSPHPAIVALPLGAWAVTAVCDVLGALTADRRYDDAARLSQAVGLVGAAGAVATGLRDYGSIPQDQPSHEVATTHGLANAAVGSLMVASYVLRSQAHQDGRSPSPTARLLGAAGSALSLYSGWLGGVLVQEYGEGVQPVMERQASGGDGPEFEGDSPRGRERLSSEAPLGLHDEIQPS